MARFSREAVVPASSCGFAPRLGLELGPILRWRNEDEFEILVFVLKWNVGAYRIHTAVHGPTGWRLTRCWVASDRETPCGEDDD